MLDNLILTSATLVWAVQYKQTVTVVYRKASGIPQVRAIRPYTIARCFNGETIVRAICAHSGEPRSFRLDRIEDVAPGDRTAVVLLNTL